MRFAEAVSKNTLSLQFLVFVLYFLHFNLNICNSYTLNLQNRLVSSVWMHLRGIINHFYFTSQNGFQCISACHAWQTQQDEKGSKGLLMFLIFKFFCWSGRCTNTKHLYLTSWEWESTINCSSWTSAVQQKQKQIPPLSLIVCELC